MKSNEVLVKFGSGIPGDAQAKVMFDMQVTLQKMGHNAWVEKATMGDDSKLRVKMTEEERNRL